MKASEPTLLALILNSENDGYTNLEEYLHSLTRLPE
jgi:hypothetical protein